MWMLNWRVRDIYNRLFFFFNATATTEIYTYYHTLSLHDALPINIAGYDGTGKYLTPGIIDIHSHLGDYPSPSVDAHSDGNEATSPTTPEVWSEHSVWPQDPGFSRALANGGVPSLQILPGRANPVGGRSVTPNNVPLRPVQGQKITRAH